VRLAVYSLFEIRAATACYLTDRAWPDGSMVKPGSTTSMTTSAPAYASATARQAKKNALSGTFRTGRF